MLNEEQPDTELDYVVVWGTSNLQLAGELALDPEVNENLDQQGPMFIKAVSARADALFEQWGVEQSADGIRPPDDVMDFINVIPGHWIMGLEPTSKTWKDFNIVEVPLPTSRLMLH